VQFVTLRQFASMEWSPIPAQCCLSPDEVYSLTAFLLFRSGIIEEDSVMNEETLPKVKMPNRDAYVPPPYLNTPWKPGMRQAQNK
jgi:cytochrome c